MPAPEIDNTPAAPLPVASEPNSESEADRTARIDGALAFLELIDARHLLVALAPGGGAVPLAVTLPTDRAQARAWIADMNRSRNIYYMLNEGGPRSTARTAADIRLLRGIAVDVDAKGSRAMADCRAAVDALPIKPTLVTATGGGVQAIWLLRPPEAASGSARVIAAAKALEALCESDAVHDLPRLLRLPFTVNWPNERKVKAGRVPVLAHALMDDGPRHTLEAIEAALAAAPIAPTADRAAKAATKASGNVILHPSVAALAGQAKPVFADDGAADDFVSITDDRIWFDKLPPERQAEAVRDMLARCQDIAAGPRAPWLKVLMAVKSTGLPEAERLAMGWCAACPEKMDDAVLKDWASLKPEGGVSIGALIHYAKQRGFDTRVWRREATLAVTAPAAHGAGPRAVPALTALPNVMSEAEALGALNARFFYAHKFGVAGSTGVEDADGSVRRVTAREMGEMLANRFVTLPAETEGGRVRHVAAARWWISRFDRREVDAVVYDPEGRAAGRVLNTWRGFGVAPAAGSWRHMRRHLWAIVCRHDRAVWKYLIRWLAHCVQHPGTTPGVCVVLRSTAEGSGKSILGAWMKIIFGRHAMEMASAQHLVGDFNGHLESLSFIALNEGAFPGDHALAARLKAFLTEGTMVVNAKHQQAYAAPNTAHVLLTSNAAWVVPAGAQARRFLVLDIDPSRANDHSYFRPILAEMEGAGPAAMLRDLLRVNLIGWNVRAVPATRALKEQQLRSADSVTRWLMDCVEARAVAPGTPGGGFGTEVAAAALFGGYREWCRDRRERPTHLADFGRKLTEAGFGTRHTEAGRLRQVPDVVAVARGALKAAGII
jgi:hypothetical protein